MKLTEAQRQLLSWLSSQSKGVTDIDDERLVESLISRGLAFKFYESDGGAPLSPVWAITDAGRAALAQGDKP